jgi:hypothetical protein
VAARAFLAARAERRIEVVRVNDARSTQPNRLDHLLRVQPSSQQSQSGTDGPLLRGVAREQLGGLANVLANEPHQILDDPLLATRRSIAVVEEQDHGAGKAYSGRDPSNGREPPQT